MLNYQGLLCCRGVVVAHACLRVKGFTGLLSQHQECFYASPTSGKCHQHFHPELQSPAFDRRLLSRAEPFEASLNNQWNYSEPHFSWNPFLPITHHTSQ